ncbi:MAG: ribonuclease H [Desulfobacterales bacterium]
MNDQITEKDGKFWKRMLFKKNRVWVASNAAGKPLVENGKCLIRYQLDQDYQYFALVRNIHPLEKGRSEKNGKSGSPPASPNISPSAASLKRGSREKKQFSENPVPPDLTDMQDVICIYTDGASSGNPGPSGIGVLMRFKGHEKEISQYIGMATNNIAELEAIRVALAQVKKKDLPVRVFTDSGYAYGLLVKGWKAQKNEELVSKIRLMLPQFRDLKFVKIRGHAGEEGNERADFLATSAIEQNRKQEK